MAERAVRWPSGDFNADGNPDIVVAHELNDAVAIEIGVELIGAGSVIGVDSKVRPTVFGAFLGELFQMDR